jgi:hypothetical protein
MTWHIPETLARAYVDGDIRDARAASVEAHLMACTVCRSLVAEGVSTDRLGSIWSAVEEQVDAPRATSTERLLTRVGLPETDARLVAAAPTLRASWFAALVAVLAFAVWVGQAGGRGAVVFLIVAPLVPVLAVAGAYGPRVDPTYEMSASTPYPTIRLVLLRSAAVVLASDALALAASMLVPDAGVAAAWLLPSLALVGLTLAIARWLSLPVAAGTVSVVYALPLLAALLADADVLDIVRSAALQWTALAVGVAALLFLTSDPQLRAALRRTR